MEGGSLLECGRKGEGGIQEDSLVEVDRKVVTGEGLSKGADTEEDSDFSFEQLLVVCATSSRYWIWVSSCVRRYGVQSWAGVSEFHCSDLLDDDDNNIYPINVMGLNELKCKATHTAL